MSDKGKISEISICVEDVDLTKLEPNGPETNEPTLTKSKVEENPYFSKEALERERTVRDDLDDIYNLDDQTTDSVEGEYAENNVESDEDPFDFALKHYVEVKKPNGEKKPEDIKIVKKEDKERYNKKKKKTGKNFRPKINTRYDPCDVFS